MTDDSPFAEFPAAEATFAAQPGSVGAARRFVGAALDSVGAPPELVEEALLTASELVANAVLHGGGPVVVRVAPAGDGERAVRLEVADPSPVLPVVREYAAGASTGRGLSLVARMADRWGIEPNEGAGGKVVWVELSDAPRSSDPVEPVAALDPPVPPRSPEALPVLFERVPVDAYLRLQEQNDAVLRELELLAFTADLAGDAEPSPELTAVIEASRQYFNVQREGFRREVAAAAERGESTVDLVGEYSPAVVAPSADYVELFERAEELAARDEMLVAPADPVVAKLRRWFIAEMSRQPLEGGMPRPFDPDDDLDVPGR
jgi:anti-sigma regulatory factor (Ser/Thr protein kinase)